MKTRLTVIATAFLVMIGAMETANSAIDKIVDIREFAASTTTACEEFTSESRNHALLSVKLTRLNNVVSDCVQNNCSVNELNVLHGQVEATIEELQHSALALDVYSLLPVNYSVLFENRYREAEFYNGGPISLENSLIKEIDSPFAVTGAPEDSVNRFPIVGNMGQSRWIFEKYPIDGVEYSRFRLAGTLSEVCTHGREDKPLLRVRYFTESNFEHGVSFDSVIEVRLRKEERRPMPVFRISKESVLAPLFDKLLNRIPPKSQEIINFALLGCREEDYEDRLVILVKQLRTEIISDSNNTWPSKEELLRMTSSAIPVEERYANSFGHTWLAYYRINLDNGAWNIGIYRDLKTHKNSLVATLSKSGSVGAKCTTAW